jgi:tetratricopeptide (TPR) repeat protein
MDSVRAAVGIRPQDPEPRLMLCQCLQALSRTEELAKELRALGELHGQRGEHQQAAEAMKRLLRIRPDDTRARIQYIDQYRHVGDERDLVDDYLKLAELHTKRGAVHEARRVFERIKHLKPDHWEARSRFVEFLLGLDAEPEAIAEALSLAEDLTKADRVREALSALAKVASAAENDPAYHRMLARAHMASNARGRAARELRRAADLYRRLRDDDGYVAALQELAQTDPMNTEVPAELVDHFEAKGDLARAREASLVLAAGLRQRGLLDLAEAELRRAARLAPDDVEVWRRLVECAREAHSDREIVDDLVGYSRALVRAGRRTEALSELRVAVNADPTSLAARLLLVETYMGAGSLQDIAEDVIALGDLLNQNGQPEEGVKWFGLLLQGDPGNTDARERLSATNAIIRGERPAATNWTSPTRSTAASSPRRPPPRRRSRAAAGPRRSSPARSPTSIRRTSARRSSRP